ncbi:DUF6449 domain-containing protein [Virgibacillus senegalensis]|uniref:DUF6449 domain-containing protein n=1 Tax=Virgibacillus senegalensis TaxID=1499679 RepID=UPI00069DDD0A|nr:DUF6449 domain-containing protein [Virgibacillus senegalensis]
MQSKTSLFNKQLLKQDLLSSGWIGIVYFAGLLFALPLNLLMLETDERMGYSFRSLFESNAEIQLFFLYIIPVLVAVFLFRYMQVKNAADFIHSLPLTRRKIFNHHFLVGILLIVLPLLFTAIILSLMLPAMDLYTVYTQADIWHWFGESVVFSLLLFSAGVLIGMLTGISAVQGVLTYIFLLFPAGILVLVYANLNILLDGFPISFYQLTNVALFSPLTDFIELYNMKFPGWKYAIYLLLSFVFYALGWFIYQKRPSEASGQPMAFHQARPIFKYGVTACMMLFGGFYFGETENQLSWIIFGYVLGSLIGYLIAEMVLQKNWQVFGKWRGYVIFLAVASAIILVFSLDVTGYESRVPEAENIKAVYFNENPMYYSRENDVDKIRELAIQDPAIIGHVRSLHKKIIEQSKGILPKERLNREKIFLSYQLEDGSMVNREYFLDLDETYEEYLKPIYESREYKEIKNPILNLNENDFDNLRISNEMDGTSGTTILEKKEIKEALQALKQDIYDQSYQEIVNPVDTMASIQVPDGEDMYYPLPILKSYEQFGNWLKAHEIYDQTVMQAEDISYAVILDKRQETDDPHQILTERRYAGKGMVIEDKGQIQDALDATASHYYGVEQGPFFIGYFVEEKDYPIIRSFTKDGVPAFVTEYFENQ